MIELRKLRVGTSFLFRGLLYYRHSYDRYAKCFVCSRLYSDGKFGMRYRFNGDFLVEPCKC